MRVLVCDDERHVQRLIQVNLERQGHSVKTVSSGNAAIEIMRAEPFDWVIIDPDMPRMSGYEVRDWIQGQPELCDLRVTMLEQKSRTVV